MKKTRNKIAIMILLIGLAVLILVIFCLYNKKSFIRLHNISQKTTNTSESVSIPPIIFKGLQKFITASKYLYFDNDHNIRLASLDGKEDKIVLYKTGQSYYLADPTISPNGKFLAYLILSDSLQKQYNEHPPIEFHGSTQFLLRLINLQTLENIQVDNNVISGAFATGKLVWKTDSSGIYYYKEDNKQSDKSYLYTIADSKSMAVKIAPEGSEFLSPDNKRIIKIEGGGSIKNTIDRSFNLKLYTSEGTPIKTLYSYPASEHYINYISSNKILLTRTTYPPSSNKDSRTVFCILEIIDVNTSKAITIDKKLCNVPYSDMGFLQPKISPDGRYIILHYNDAESEGHELEYFSKFIVYDLASKQKKELFSRDELYNDYYFVTPHSIVALVHTYDEDDHTESYKSFNMDIEKNTIEPNTIIGEKHVISIF